MALAVGDPAPDFTLKTDEGAEVKLSALRGRNVVVYFYPKDDTPGCTTEACSFRDNLPDFSSLQAEIIGISKDSTESHGKFRKKYNLNFYLASDEDGSVCEAYGVWVEKTNYGKKYMGIERSTFVIDKEGIIRSLWRRVKVEGHTEKVLAALKEL